MSSLCLILSLGLHCLRDPNDCHFDPSWIQKFPGIGTSSKGTYVIVLEIHISCKHNNTGNTYASIDVDVVGCGYVN